VQVGNEALTDTSTIATQGDASRHTLPRIEAQKPLRRQTDPQDIPCPGSW
jgi:hypothetical protein